MLIEIRDSPIAGKGVFAKEVISAGTELADSLSAEFLKTYSVGQEGWDNPSVILVGGVLIGYEDSRGSWQDFLNHATDANCTFEVPHRLVTLRTIAKDEELTLDYRKHVHQSDKVYAEVIGTTKEP